MAQIIDSSEVQKLIDDALAAREEQDRYYQATDDSLLRAQKNMGLAERQLAKYELQIKSIAQPMANWMDSTKAVVLGLAGTREATDENTRMLPRYGIQIAKLLIWKKKHMQFMKDEQVMYNKNKENFSLLMRAYQGLRLSILKIFSAAYSMTMAFAAAAVIFGVLSLALQGTDSALFQFYESLDPMNQMLAILSGMGVIIYAFGGTLGLVAAAVAGFAAVLSGTLSPALSVVTALVSGILLAIAAMIAGIASAPVLIGIAIVTILTLIYRFRKEIYEFFDGLGEAIWNMTFGPIIRGLKRLAAMVRTFKADPMGSLRGMARTGVGLARNAANQISSQDNSTTNIYITGSNSRGSDEQLATAISRELTSSKRRRGGGLTQGALP